MKIKEFEERELLVERSGRILDQDGNEYRNENGEMQYLEIPDKVLGQILAEQTQKGIELEGGEE